MLSYMDVTMSNKSLWVYESNKTGFGAISTGVWGGAHNAAAISTAFF